MRKNASLRNQIQALLDVFMPGYTSLCDVFGNPAAHAIARGLKSAAEVCSLGTEGLAQLLKSLGVRHQRRTLEKILGWARGVESPVEYAEMYHTILLSLDDERCARLERIATLEQQMAGLLVRTPYVVLLSIPGIGIVTAGEFAGEMGPITHYANDTAITGRAGIYPSRYQSDQVDRCDGPLVGRGNRRLRGVIMMIADNLLICNRFFQTLKEPWKAAGMDQRAMCVRAAKRFCRIAYQMVAGGQLFRHPSCQQRDAILRKLSCFHVAHGSSMTAVMSDLQAALDHIPQSAACPRRKASSRRCNLVPADSHAGCAGWERFCPQSWPSWR